MIRRHFLKLLALTPLTKLAPEEPLTPEQLCEKYGFTVDMVARDGREPRHLFDWVFISCKRHKDYHASIYIRYCGKPISVENQLIVEKQKCDLLIETGIK